MPETVGRLKWDQTGQRLYETGVKKGVLFPMNTSGAYGNGVAWNGLTGAMGARIALYNNYNTLINIGKKILNK